MKAAQIHRIFLLVLFALLFSTGCAGRKNLPLGVVPDLTPPNETKVAQTKQAIEGSLAQSVKIFSVGSPESKRVIRIVRRLKEAAGGKDIDFPVYVADAGPEMVNALAVNGSAVIVFKALLDNIKDDNQVAAVLAHELGHLSGKHADDKGEERRSSWVKVGSAIIGVAAGVAIAAAGGNSANVRDATQLGYGVTNKIGQGGIVKAYSREMENEADQIGIVLMARAGYDPEGAISLWKNADKLLGDQSSKHSTFWSTHPSSEDRVQHLEAALPYARTQFREQTPEQIRLAKLEDAKLDKIGTDTKKAEELYEQAMSQIRAGNKKASLVPLKKFLGFAEQYGWNNATVQNAKVNVSIIENNGQAEPITPEEMKILFAVRNWYVRHTLSPAQADNIVKGMIASTRTMPYPARIANFVQTLQQLTARGN